MLWLALQFPHLAIDTRPGAETQTEPLAISEAQGARRIIIAANAAARVQGVRAGQVLGAAQTLCAELKTATRRSSDEDAAMQSLALWALGYSSLVARHGDDTLLVEIGASRLLFDNERRLLQAIAVDLEGDGLACVAGLAATASAARLFASAGHGRIVRDLADLREHITAIELHHGDLPTDTCDALAGVGVRRYGALLRLPRHELARRFGQVVPDHLDTLLGRRAEVIVPMRIAERFRQRLEWPHAIANSMVLLFPARRLLVAAAHWLVACQRSTTRLRLAFAHEDHPDTVIDLGLGQSSADREHLIAVVRARLERLTLPQGCVALTLELTETQALDAPSRDLFVRHGEAPEDAQQLLDRLQGRLGDTAVERFVVAEDHRPEFCVGATHGSRFFSRPTGTSQEKRFFSRPTGTSQEKRFFSRPTGTSQEKHRDPWVAPTTAMRPMFLLSEPQPVAQWPSFDWRRARLSLPERIESGWWDEADATRDYYRLDQTDGARLWVFRNRQAPHDWFVQGVYA
ncbi:MAG TPA: DNA polymerase Y family protein [Pseudomonadota bacterium]|nr:DNA polymerase Y family protein [Pseudomonadota bacterium]